MATIYGASVRTLKAAEPRPPIGPLFLIFAAGCVVAVALLGYALGYAVGFDAGRISQTVSGKK